MFNTNAPTVQIEKVNNGFVVDVNLTGSNPMVDAMGPLFDKLQHQLGDNDILQKILRENSNERSGMEGKHVFASWEDTVAFISRIQF